MMGGMGEKAYRRHLARAARDREMRKIKKMLSGGEARTPGVSPSKWRGLDEINRLGPLQGDV